MATGIYLSLCMKPFIENSCPKFFLNLVKYQTVTNFLLCCNDEIISLREPGLIEPEKFSDEAFYPVSFYRVAGLFGDSDP